MHVIHVFKNFEMTSVAQNRVMILITASKHFVMSHFKTKRFDYSAFVPTSYIRWTTDTQPAVNLN